MCLSIYFIYLFILYSHVCCKLTKLINCYGTNCQMPQIEITISKFLRPMIFRHLKKRTNHFFITPKQGARCEMGFDPCEEHVCLNGGTCSAIGEHENFAECINCSSGWSGPHCEEREDICISETRRLGRPPCYNGGHCVSSLNGTVLKCFCESGWQGERCDVSFSRVSLSK